MRAGELAGEPAARLLEDYWRAARNQPSDMARKARGSKLHQLSAQVAHLLRRVVILGS